MNRIAILADIHGNMPALRAVLADIDSQSPDEVLVGGDLVGRGPEGSRVIAAIRERGWPTIRGNHEDYLLDFHHRRVPKSWWEANEWSASRWMSAELSEDDITHIDSLPYSYSLTRDSPAQSLLLAHGTPDSANEGIGPWTSDRALTRHLASIEEDLLVVGHTHRPMLREVPTGRVVNVGSVGLPFNGDHRAQYAIFDWVGDDWEIRFRQIDYDQKETLAIYRSSGFLEAGGITAQLLEIELRKARPHLVPFLHWARTLRREPNVERLSEFLELYDSEEPLQQFFMRVSAGD